MKKIALPKNIKFEEGEEPFRKTAVIDPLYPGYGTTVGNALRRVLLSSLPGTAVIGVKIEGADHEFMALPNISEDVLEIILNLKQLNMQIHSDEVVKLELNAHGETEVTAKDIKTTSDVEIMNPDLKIATITDMAGKLNMEIFVRKGMGYETIENREDRQKEIGYIEVDSIFSPVRGVGIKIENTRVGKMTNWDKLSLDIVTDGTIDPEGAFNQAVQILLDQFQAIQTIEPNVELSEELDKEEKETVAEDEEASEDNKDDAGDKENKPEDKDKGESDEGKEDDKEESEEDSKK